ncbi:YheC/YheD family protein [Paenibacillus zanthoxyli]|uniref:YheC/YheD family protein n=1 Tax=Paenibacillus zanthoxyli TaxID=369399 RepID=UPI0004BA7A1E|nr:YheC/YheD family protein [Paenibacillus zanthoxyli]
MQLSLYKVKGKMIKHQILLNQPEISPYLPETHWFSADRAVQMLKKYPSIFIKPNGGSGGAGIIRVRKTVNGYETAHDRSRHSLGSPSLHRTLRSYERSPKQYIVQRGLDLASYKGKLFDLRIYLQKPAGQWMVSGTVARVAAPHRFVTNHTRGGHAASLPRVLLPVYGNNRSKTRHSINTIRKLSLIIAKTLNKSFSDIHELGIDFGIDKKGRIWFIEANSRPAHHLFTQLPDKTMLRRIHRNKRLIFSNKKNVSQASLLISSSSALKKGSVQ